MIAPAPANPAVPAAQPGPDRIKRQEVIVLTQTIVTPDSTRTAVITLGNGGHPGAGAGATSAPDDPFSSAAPPPRASSAGGSTGPSPAQIGIILGCCLGALVLLVALWFCLSTARRRREAAVAAEIEEGSFGSSYYYTSDEEPEGGGGGGGAAGGAGGGFARPGRPAPTHWPWQSIPPPPVPTYTARDPRQWQASARAAHTMRQ